MMTIQIVITMFTNAKAMPTISGLPHGQWLFLNIIVRWVAGNAVGKKKSTCNAGGHLQCKRPGFDPWVGQSPGEGNGNPLHYFCLGNLMDRGAWQATVYRITKIRHDLATKPPPPPPAWCPTEGWAIPFAGQATEGSLYIYINHQGSQHDEWTWTTANTTVWSSLYIWRS